MLSADTTSSSEWTQLTVSDTLFLIEDDTVTIVLDSGLAHGALANWSYFDLVTVEKTGTLVTIDTGPAHYPKHAKLFQNFPNPFNPSTQISYVLAEADFVTLKIYNMSGREIRSLVNTYQRDGRYSVHFDGAGLASGIYFCKLLTGRGFTETKKMLLLR